MEQLNKFVISSNSVPRLDEKGKTVDKASEFRAMKILISRHG